MSLRMMLADDGPRRLLVRLLFPQVRKPARDLPLGILGALGIVTACYMLMSAALVMMVPIGQLELGAPFAAAFT